MKHRSLIILTVCIALMACNRKVVPTTTETSVRDTTIIKEVERLVEVKIPGDTVEIVKWIECDSATLKPKPVIQKKKSGRSTLDLTIDKSGKLTATANCDTYIEKIKVLDREVSRLRQESKKETVVVTKYKTRFIDKVCRWIAGIVVLIIGGYVGFKFLKPRFLIA